jgi:hypothetical protein
MKRIIRFLRRKKKVNPYNVTQGYPHVAFPVSVPVASPVPATPLDTNGDPTTPNPNDERVESEKCAIDLAMAITMENHEKKASTIYLEGLSSPHAPFPSGTTGCSNAADPPRPPPPPPPSGPSDPRPPSSRKKRVLPSVSCGTQTEKMPPGEYIPNGFREVGTLCIRSQPYMEGDLEGKSSNSLKLEIAKICGREEYPDSKSTKEHDALKRETTWVTDRWKIEPLDFGSRRSMITWITNVDAHLRRCIFYNK